MLHVNVRLMTKWKFRLKKNVFFELNLSLGNTV